MSQRSSKPRLLVPFIARREERIVGSSLFLAKVAFSPLLVRPATREPPRQPESPFKPPMTSTPKKSQLNTTSKGQSNHSMEFTMSPVINRKSTKAKRQSQDLLEDLLNAMDKPEDKAIESRPTQTPTTLPKGNSEFVTPAPRIAEPLRPLHSTFDKSS